MIPRKKNTASGVITFHTPFSVRMLKSQDCATDVKDATETRKSLFLPSMRPRSTSGCVRAGKTDEESSSRQKLGPKQDWLSHTSLRQLQAKMEAENQEARKIFKPLLDTENGFVKELERFLRQLDVTQLRRRELLHKRWTERVWFPLQMRVEEHVSSCSPVEAKRRQILYNQFLHHCNTKGFVFLETYDPKEYNPFLFNIKQLHYFKLNKDDLKDPLFLQLHERQEEKRTASSYEAGCQNTKRHVEKLPQSGRLFTESVTLQANTRLQASSSYPASTSRKTPADTETEGRESIRINTAPYHKRANGSCHYTSCLFSRCGCRQQPASLQQLQSSPISPPIPSNTLVFPMYHS